MTLVLAAAVLAVVTSGSAFAMIPQASLVDSSGGLNAQWDNNPNNRYTIYRGNSLTERDTWMYSSHAVSASTDAIYFYSCPGTMKTMDQIYYANQFSQYGQGVTRDTSVQVGSSTGSYTYQISLGFYPHVSPFYTYFANPMKPESLTVY